MVYGTAGRDSGADFFFDNDNENNENERIKFVTNFKRTNENGVLWFGAEAIEALVIRHPA